MQIASPLPTLGISVLARAPSTTQRNAAGRTALKFTNGPAAVALASRSVGTKLFAISAAIAGGALPSFFASAKQPTARSPSSARGGTSTFSSVGGTSAYAATTEAAARCKGVW